MRSLLGLVLFVSVLGIGCKGDPEKCEKACRNYAELVFWEKADAEISQAPVEKRDELRKQKLAEFTKNLENGINTCTSKCLSANKEDDIKCMIDAKTAKQAKACVED
jgi:hypothetical protein